MSVLNAIQAREFKRNQELQNMFFENKSKYSRLKPMEKQVTLLIANNKKITDLIPVKGENGEAATEDKGDLKMVIAQTAGTICSYASDYALETGNTTLFHTVSYTTSSLTVLRDIEVLGVINIIVGAVTPLLSNEGFTEYPVTGEDLSALTKNATTYNDNLGKAVMIDTASGTASREIDAILKVVRGIIVRLSKQIVFFKKNDHAFVEAYYKAIEIDYSNVHHSGVKGVIINSITEQPVEKASVILAGKTNTKSTFTGEEGNYEIIKFRQGKCKLTISAPGFEEQVIHITIVRGRITEFNIALIAQISEIRTAI